MPERVAFLGIEPDEDLILSFAISKGGPGEIVSLILHLSKYDSLLPDEASDIHVSHEAHPDLGDEFLRKLAWKAEEVEVESTVRRYVLDVSRADAAAAQRRTRLNIGVGRDSLLPIASRERSWPARSGYAA